LEKYRADLDRLISDGGLLSIALSIKCNPEQVPELEKSLKDSGGDPRILKNLPSFEKEYQTWYSEVKALIRQLLPDRLDDLIRHYEKPKGRKEITSENYRIEDCLQGLIISQWSDKIAGPEAAIPHFAQQLAILRAVKARFESSLFEIRSLVQADIFDSEIEAARELAKNGYLRASGAVCGVIIEAHLAEVMRQRGLSSQKKNPSISDYNNTLKDASVVDTPQWRFIQHLADIRNICDHKKSVEPTAPQIQDLIDGVGKIIKTIF